MTKQDRLDLGDFQQLPEREPMRLEVPSRNSDRIDGSFITKMIVGAVVFTVATLGVSVRVMVANQGDDAEINPVVAIVVVLCSATLGAGLGAMLGIKDRAEKRLANGEQVGPLMRLLFGGGVRSLWAWILLIFFSVLILFPIFLTVFTL